MQNSIIVIDDEQDFLESVRRGLAGSGFTNVKLENDPRRAAVFFEQGQTADLALIDINMPGVDGLALLEHIKHVSPETECIMITALNEARMAVDCLKKGAYDYLVKPFTREDLIVSIKRALERKRLFQIVELIKNDSLPELINKEAFRPVVTRSARMLKLLREAELHAASDVPILITGESGTGKELLAKAIHQTSLRSKFPFTAVNMLSVAGSLFDAEFFGHTRGAFTGAEKDRVGYLEYTNRGTLFLDEIGDLPLEFQGKLLRVLQDGEYMKLGANQTLKTDIRFIAATNQNIEKMVAEGTFRKDLYYRLRGTWLHLPPLRDRKEDVPLLVNRFLGEFTSPDSAVTVDEEAMSLLMEFDYPGNIRELRSMIQSGVNLAQGGLFSVHCLPEYLRHWKPVPRKVFLASDRPIVPLEVAEREHIMRAYEATGRNKVQTARILGIGLNTLRRKLETYSIS